MKKYVKSINNGKSSIDSAQQTKSEAKKEDRQINNIKLNEPENKRQSNQKRNKAPVPAIDSAKSFRDIAKEERQDTVIRQGKMAYGVSGILIIALLLSTVVMLNNYGELKNKRRDESVIFSMQTFVVKLASGVAALVVSVCLSLSHLSQDTAVVAGEAAQAGGSLVGLRMTMTVLPIAGLLLAVFYFHKKYILTESKMEEMNNTLRA